MPIKNAEHLSFGNFRIEIDSIDAASFRKCEGLKTETEIYEYREGGNNETVLKLVGPTRHNNIILTKGFVNDPALFQWREEIHATGTAKITRRNGSIVLLAADNKTEISRWNFQKAWPVRWEGPSFDSSSGGAACEVLELAVERITKA